MRGVRKSYTFVMLSFCCSGRQHSQKMSIMSFQYSMLMSPNSQLMLDSLKAVWKPKERGIRTKV